MEWKYYAFTFCHIFIFGKLHVAQSNSRHDKEIKYFHFHSYSYFISKVFFYVMFIHFYKPMNIYLRFFSSNKWQNHMVYAIYRKIIFQLLRVLHEPQNCMARCLLMTQLSKLWEYIVLHAIKLFTRYCRLRKSNICIKCLKGYHWKWAE